MKTIIKNIPYVIWGLIKLLLTASIGAVLFMAVCVGLAFPLITYAYMYSDGSEYISIGFLVASITLGIVLYSVISYILFRPETKEEKEEREREYHNMLMSVIRNYKPE